MGPESTDPLPTASTTTTSTTRDDQGPDPPSFADILDTESTHASPSDPPPPYPVDSETEGEPKHGKDPEVIGRDEGTDTGRGYPPRRRIRARGLARCWETSKRGDEARISPIVRSRSEGYYTVSPGETTPLLTPRIPQQQHGHHGRSRSHSYTSTMSAAPSLARTVRELFQTDDATDYAEGMDVLGSGGPGIGRVVGGADCASTPRPRTGLGTRLKRYFRPMVRKVYYKALFHLLLVNFPYALLAWVYLFVFTVTGTTLLVALPLGAVLCFFNLLGARVLAAGELKLQTKFHALLGHHRPLPYPPRPIFVRQRPIMPSEIEASGDPMCSGYMVPERSFYKNTYAMFTDSTSYQALFYFLVVKPAITLLVTILFWGLGVPLFVLVVPAPSVLRAARRIGIWQASVAIEGLYLAVR